MKSPNTAQHEAPINQSEPTVEAVSVPTHKNRELYWLVGGGIAIVVFIIIAYKFGKQPVIPTPTQPSPTSVAQTSPTINTDSMTNWKTYTNEKYNYAIQYPQDWVFNLSGDSGLYIKNFVGWSNKETNKGVIYISVWGDTKTSEVKNFINAWQQYDPRNKDMRPKPPQILNTSIILSSQTATKTI